MPRELSWRSRVKGFSGWTVLSVHPLLQKNQLQMGCCFSVPNQQVGMIQQWGRYVRTAPPGCHVINPCLCQGLAGTISLRVQQLDVECETKTKDNVFVRVNCSVQYQVDLSLFLSLSLSFSLSLFLSFSLSLFLSFSTLALQVIPNEVYVAFYTLSSPRAQIEHYVYDVVRATVPRISLDELFETKDEIARTVKTELHKVMTSYGYFFFFLFFSPSLPLSSRLFPLPPFLKNHIPPKPYTLYLFPSLPFQKVRNPGSACHRCGPRPQSEKGYERHYGSEEDERCHHSQGRSLQNFGGEGR